MKPILISAVSLLLVSACSGDTPLSKAVAPSPLPATAPPAASYRVKGMVFVATATGALPLEGAHVQGPRGAAVTTGIDGAYALTGLSGTTFINVTRPGYAPFQAALNVTADTQFDIPMVRAATVSLSGVVFEMLQGSRVPIEGVEVYCDSCGEDGHTFLYTDASGRYRFPELFGRGYTLLLLRKDGYAVKNAIAVGNLEGAAVVVDTDTEFDIELVRR
ncbi:MAG TPA: hypothetical protein VL262_12100 [Vicinamibacterales bacterium]|jgi:hypothetical protein|nr:hypothetical protein [Vicinamibacterales bacterium]